MFPRQILSSIIYNCIVKLLNILRIFYIFTIFLQQSCVSFCSLPRNFVSFYILPIFWILLNFNVISRLQSSVKNTDELLAGNRGWCGKVPISLDTIRFRHVEVVPARKFKLTEEMLRAWLSVGFHARTFVYKRQNQRNLVAFLFRWTVHTK